MGEILRPTKLGTGAIGSWICESRLDKYVSQSRSSSTGGSDF